MRVVVNLYGLHGLKTGVAHYTEQLLRAMRAVTDRDVLDTIPGPWLVGSRELLRRRDHPVPADRSGAGGGAGLSGPDSRARSSQKPG